MDTKLVIERSKLIDILHKRLKKDQKTANKLSEEIQKEDLGYPTKPDKPELITVSIFTQDFNQIGNNLIGYLIADNSGFGYPHNEIRKMYNNDDYDYRKMPKLLEFHWIVNFNNKGVELALNQVELNHAEDMKPRPYWRKGGKVEEDSEHWEWVPLHCDWHKGGFVTTPVLGVHFNFAIKWFTENVVKEIKASYPIDLVDDTAGGYDIYRV
jgi:hypothetical protein